MLGPRTRRASNRLAEHVLEVVREGHFQGLPAILTRCIDPACPNIAKDGSAWSGWFTNDEMSRREA